MIDPAIQTIFEKLCSFLDAQQVQYRTVHHEPTYTSEESARARNEDVRIGGKAIVMKVDDAFHLFVLSAALKIDAKKIKRHLSAKATRFATPEELLSLTSLVPGSVPPFGRPILDLSLFIDTSVTEQEKIAFNAGALTDSIIMKTDEYLRVSSGTIFSFSQ